jgi:hypothetical protein
MHKGRIYPFAPEYWVVESYFWPAYPSWRLNLSVVLIIDPNFFPIRSAPSPCFSDPSISLDGRSITYHWLTTWTADSSDLLLTVKRIEVGGILYTHWHLQILLDDVVIGHTYFYGGYNNPEFNASPGNFFSVDNPSETGLQTIITFGPVSYRDGGSPYV